MRQFALRSSGIIILLILWELVSRTNLIDPGLFPPPSQVISALVSLTLSGQLPKDVFASVLRAVAGFILGSMAGLFVGAVSGRIRAFDAVLTPVVQVLRPIPVIALVPLAIVWFGLGETSKIFLVFWGVFFPVWVSSYLGISRVDKNYIWAARSIGVRREKLWLQVILPAALPTIITGLRTSISLAFIVLVAAEMAGSYLGVGYRISAYHLVFQIDKMMGYIVLMGALGFIADRTFAYLVNRTLPWYQLSVNQD
ncbi:MAG: ABC transporter permease [Candidatus Thiodiazotropha sp.]